MSLMSRALLFRLQKFARGYLLGTWEEASAKLRACRERISQKTL